MIKFLTLLFLILLSIHIDAQELNCQVSISSSQVDGDKRRFTTLQTTAYEFMNSRQWTSRKYEPEERIECSVFITLDNNTSGEYYSGSIQIQSRRPVFNSSYNSPLINIKDNDLKFTWVEYDPLNFDINSFSNNLSSVLAYYAYLIIGMDFDSYSPLGGTLYFNNAQTIVNNAQSSGYTGWKQFENNDTRYWFVANVLNSRYEDFRNFNYQFHRLGLDAMYDSESKGRVQALASLKLLQNVNRIEKDIRIVKTLMDAKRDEFVGLFAGGQANEKTQAKAILIELEPSKTETYQKIDSQKR